MVSSDTAADALTAASAAERDVPFRLPIEHNKELIRPHVTPERAHHIHASVGILRSKELKVPREVLILLRLSHSWSGKSRLLVREVCPDIRRVSFYAS